MVWQVWQAGRLGFRAMIQCNEAAACFPVLLAARCLVLKDLALAAVASSCFADVGDLKLYLHLFVTTSRITSEVQVQS